jgi:hypothetical protein
VAQSPFEMALLRVGQGPVLEVPAGSDGTEPVPNAVAMLRALAHGRPVLNGYSSYFPADYVSRMRLAAALPDPRAAAELRALTGLGTLVVHLEGLGAGFVQQWEAAWTRPKPPLRPLFRTKDTMVFSITDDPSPW